jgi:hypothetical protein
MISSFLSATARKESQIKNAAIASKTTNCNIDFDVVFATYFSLLVKVSGKTTQGTNDFAFSKSIVA